jgi:hypothetical protein
MPEINTILIKRRTTGQPGAPTSLSGGELAFNEVNSVLYYGSQNGVIPIGGPGEYATNSLVSSVSTNLIRSTNSLVSSVSADLRSQIGTLDLRVTNEVRTLNSTVASVSSTLDAKIDAQIAAVIDFAPEALNTLNELASALGDDQNFASNLVTKLGNVNSTIASVSSTLTSKVDQISGNYLDKRTGGTINGNLNVNNKITAISGLEIFANSGSTTFFVSSGVVGINTKTPNQALTVSGNISASGLIYGDGSRLTGIVAGDTAATTLVRSNSALWQSTYNTVSGLSGSWVRFQPNPDYVPANIAGAVTNGSWGTQVAVRFNANQYNSDNYQYYYDGSYWQFTYTDNEGTDGGCTANSSGGTYPWNVTYPVTTGNGNNVSPSPTQEIYARLTPKALSATAFEGNSVYAAKADHIHRFPTALEVGAAPIVGGKIPLEYIPEDYEDVSLFSSFLNLPNTTYTVTTNVSISGYNYTNISGNYTASNETPANDNSSRIYKKYLYPGYYLQLSVISSRWTISDMFGAVLVRATVNASSNTPSQTTWSAGTTVSLVANSTPNSAAQGRIYITTDNNRAFRYDANNNYYAPVNGLEIATVSDEKMSITVGAYGSYVTNIGTRNANDINSKPQYDVSSIGWNIIYNGSAWQATRTEYPEDADPYQVVETAAAGNVAYPWLANWYNTGIRVKKANDLVYNAFYLPKPLEVVGSIGSSNLAAREDHVHPLPVNAANWDSVYSNVNSNSANILNYFPLSGGIITGNTRINSNLTVYGNISATGTSYFSNTIYSTTSALSVINIGNDGPALYIGNRGTGDIASFYDLDQNFEVFHIGGNNGSYPNVGVKTSTPNKDLTVNGELSASNTIYDGIGNSTQWNSVYNNTNSLSSRWESNFNLTNSLSSRWESDHNNTKSLSANWDSVYNGTRALSSRWESSFNGTNSLSSRWESNFNGTNSLSSRWESNFNGTRALSGNWDSVYNGTRSLSSAWQSTFNTVSALSGSWLTYQPYPDDLVANNATSTITVNGNTVLTTNGQATPRYDLFTDGDYGGFHVWKDGTQWYFEKNNCGSEDCGQEYLYISLTDGAYPWLATWPAGVRVEKTQKPRLVSSLSATTFEGISNFAARVDHTHALPTASQVGAAPIVNGLIPSQYLPSYVDDVIEVSTYNNLPVTTFVLSGSATYNGNYRTTGSTFNSYPTYVNGLYTLRRRSNPTRWQVINTSTGSEVLRSTNGGNTPASSDTTWQSPITVTLDQNSIGATGKIYVVLDTGKCYRWSGSMYVEISNTLELALVQTPDNQAPAIFNWRNGSEGPYTSLPSRNSTYNGKTKYDTGSIYTIYNNGSWEVYLVNDDGDDTILAKAANGNETYPWQADWTAINIYVTRIGTYDANLLPKNLTSVATTGTSTLAARADHTHALPSALEISAAPIVNGKIPAQYLPEALNGGTF